MCSERVISTFPLPYNSSSTPYNNLDFDAEVKEHCEQEIGHNHLRIAKCIVVGDIAVGKTCLINRFGYNVYGNNYKATIGVDFDVQKFNIIQIPFSLQIWDTAGQERFKCITSTYYRGAHITVIVFDLSNISTLLSCKNWLQEVLDANSRCDKPLIFLVGTKKDLLSEGANSFVSEEAIKMANELDAEYWSVSSQTGENVNELFSRISALTFNVITLKEICAKKEHEAIVANGNKNVKFAENFIKLKREDKKKKNYCVQFNCVIK